MSTINIPPAIANEEAFLQFDRVGSGRVQKHAGLWFPALAGVAVSRTGMKTNLDRIERRNRCPKAGVYRLNDLAAKRSSAHIRLIGDRHEKKACLLQLRAAIDDIRIKLEFLDARRRKRKSVAHYGPVEHAVPIQENRALPYFVLSHFVSAVLSMGWETNKCQMTACNASVCGVVFTGLTVGMMTQTSATFAV